MRRTARWQTKLGERILEALRDAGRPCAVRYLAAQPYVVATRAQVRERTRYLAGIDLVEYEPGHMADWVELTGDGYAYLEGEVDAGLRWRRIDRSLA